ncbi:MAG TPA: response regulator transcription factor [Nocardioides sp.]|nr:response regulator transcription factor [Nocardioides sp.]
MSNILLIEDDDSIRAALERGLSDRGHLVRTAATGIAGLEEVLGEPPDVVLLDLGLPDVDGIAVIGMIRAGGTVPIIVVTAAADDPTMIQALDAGADDYVVKPFGLEHVAARIRAVVRRTQQLTAEPVSVGELHVDEPSRTATLAGRPLTLSRLEFDLLLALARRPGVVVSKSELLRDVWQQPDGSERTIDVHLSWLRRKLGETAAEPRYLHSVRGVGVRLVDSRRNGQGRETGS